MYEVKNIRDVQLLDMSTHEPIAKLDGVNDVVVEEPYIEPFSRLAINREASFEATLEDCGFLAYAVDKINYPTYMEYYAPILIQARWHKKPRINKKWLKRYGMKKDTVLVRCNIKYIEDRTLYFTESVNYKMTFDDIQYKLRPDQMRRNLRMELNYDN